MTVNREGKTALDKRKAITEQDEQAKNYARKSDSHGEGKNRQKKKFKRKINSSNGTRRHHLRSHTQSCQMIHDYIRE